MGLPDLPKSPSVTVLDALLWAGGIFGVLIVYEAVRFVVVGKMKRRLRQSTKAYIKTHGVRLDRYKLTRRGFMKAELLSDPVITAAIAERARESGESVAVLRDNVEEWIDEIVPAFNVLSYYKLGYNASRLAMNLVYDVVIDQRGLQKVRDGIPDNAVVVYMMNHRSNADFVLVSYMLARQIALAFAVGEWARVWPLEVMFRSFGSYFVRRGFREKLYHTVLRRYVQMTCRYGITQGVFPEGGLSRDGFLRKPKIGLLDYIVRIKEDGDMPQDVLFVPVGINFDRVLEDKSLLADGKIKAGERKRPTSMAKFKSLVSFAVRFPVIILANLLRVLTGRVKRHGYATAAFGEPLSLNEWLTRHPDLFELSREDRKARVQLLADEVMEAISREIPATPVPVVARALCAADEDGKPTAAVPGTSMSRDDLVREVRGLRDRLRSSGARLITGKGFEESARTRERLEEERQTRSSELLDFEDEMTAADEAEETVKVALELLGRRKVISRKKSGGQDIIEVQDAEVLAYYARSIAHLGPDVAS